jgi:putative phosphoesterase
MVDRVAVLADVHCVLPALDAVLAEPDVQTADLVVLAGDVAVGPLPEQTVDRITELGERVVWVRGNCERITLELAEEPRAGWEPHVSFAAWGAGKLRPDQLELLAGLPKTATLTVSGLGNVLVCHGTPRDDEEYILVDSTIARWQEVLDGTSADVVVLGHTHMPFMRLVDRKVMVNPGSVGMPYGTSGAHWALIGGTGGPAVQLRRTLYDTRAAEEQIRRDCDFAGLDEWLENYLRNTSSDVEALETFNKRIT